MEFTRKAGIAITMIIPAFVLGGAVWELTHSWWAVLCLEIMIVVTYALIISGKLLAVLPKSKDRGE